MSQCQIHGAWNDTRTRIKQAWSDLSEDDIVAIDGDRNRLIAAIQTRYGTSHDEAQRQVDSWLGAL